MIAELSAGRGKPRELAPGLQPPLRGLRSVARCAARCRLSRPFPDCTPQALSRSHCDDHSGPRPARAPPHSCHSARCSRPPVAAATSPAAPPAAAQKITIPATSDARADAATYLAQLCPKPIGGDLNFMVWEGYTDTLFTKPFETACGVKVNATYMGTSDDLVAKLRAGGAETIDLISPSSDAVTAIIEAGLAQPLDLKRIPSYGDLMAELPRSQGGPEGHVGVRAPLGVRSQSADLRHHQGEARARQLGGAVGQEVPRQALACRTTSPRSTWWPRCWAWMIRPTRASSTIFRMKISPGSRRRCWSSSPTSGSTGPPPVT